MFELYMWRRLCFLHSKENNEDKWRKKIKEKKWIWVKAECNVDCFCTNETDFLSSSKDLKGEHKNIKFDDDNTKKERFNRNSTKLKIKCETTGIGHRATALKITHFNWLEWIQSRIAAWLNSIMDVWVLPCRHHTVDVTSHHSFRSAVPLFFYDFILNVYLAVFVVLCPEHYYYSLQNILKFV